MTYTVLFSMNGYDSQTPEFDNLIDALFRLVDHVRYCKRINNIPKVVELFDNNTDQVILRVDLIEGIDF
jgi:hypothetical protein